MRIEVQVGTQSQLREAIAADADVIMLANMSIAEIRESVAIVRRERPSLTIEALFSGDVETIRELAECGVDLIGVAALTQSAYAVEISLKTTPL
jgi:nicotinate-nucleotide pyrophosphorylase (carboxylating)